MVNLLGVHVALIGMMGSGKSTVGQQLSERLNAVFVDLDKRIESVANKAISNIFREDGERVFRHLEEEQIRVITNEYRDASCVLATGGGAILNASVRDILRTKWYTVWLNVDVDVLVERLGGHTSHRPLLPTGQGLKDRLEWLLKERTMFYQEASHTQLSINTQSLDQLVEQVFKRIRALP